MSEPEPKQKPQVCPDCHGWGSVPRVKQIVRNPMRPLTVFQNVVCKRCEGNGIV